MKKKVAVTFTNEQKLQPYLRALQSVGVEPVPVSPSDPTSLQGIDGLLLTGGPDVNPALYNEQPLDSTEFNPARDEMEAKLLKHALDRDLPILAICRGMQFLNVALGGTLRQDVKDHRTVTPDDPSQRIHDVRVEPKTKLSKILGQEVHAVNSRHHQAIEVMAPDLMESARSVEDKVIEGVEHRTKRFTIAVQWHPEDQLQEDKKLFQAFADAL